jgi:aryl-alcohol dehydrogenase-like predicted oxidoreductase
VCYNPGKQEDEHAIPAPWPHRRLGTDTIDLYQTHRPDLDISLDEMVRQGKVRYIGSSTAPAWRIIEALMVSEVNG